VLRRCITTVYYHSHYYYNYDNNYNNYDYYTFDHNSPHYDARYEFSLPVVLLN